MAEMILEVSTWPNPAIRTYWSRLQLTEYHSVLLVRGMAQGHDTFANLADSAVGRLILEIPGVIEVKIKAYALDVLKADSYTWEEIEPHILELLRGLNAAAEPEGGLG